jgi:ABC-2 type transport system ATP-binding protein
MDSVIETHALSRRFGELTAVKALTLQVGRGEIFGFLGPNGAGKTTTIKMLCGLLAPSSGSGRVAGCDIAKESKQIKRRTGYMAQAFSLYPDLTAEENFRFFAGVYGLGHAAQHKRMAELFDRVGISDRKRTQAGRLSGGLKQRLALACALVHSPELVFLDEPTAGVDPNQRQRLWDLLYDLCQDGTSLFVTTHYLDEAERCHQVGFMLGGELVAMDSPQALRSQLDGHLLGIEVTNPVAVMRAIGDLPGVSDITLYGRELRLFFREPTTVAAHEANIRARVAQAGGTLVRIEALAPSLEDLFMRFTRGVQAA